MRRARVRRVGFVRICLALLSSILLSGSGTSAFAQETERKVLGASAAIAPSAFDAEQVELPAGSVLRSEPRPESPVMFEIDARTAVELFERSDRWALVRVESIKGWVDLEQPVPERVLEDLTIAIAPVRVDDPDFGEERWQRAREILSEEPESVGSFWLLSDLPSQSRVRLALRSALRCLPEAYAARYGGQSIGLGGDKLRVVAFAKARDYERYASTESHLAHIDSGGHAGAGVAALRVDDRRYQRAVALLVHEVVHLFNERRFGLTLPVWLDEGLAEEMAISASINGDCSNLGSFPQLQRTVSSGYERGELVVYRNEFASGQLVELGCVLDSWRRRGFDLDLLSSTFEGFTRSEGRRERYAASAMLVRFLLDGSRPARREALLHELARAEKGLEPDLAQALVDHGEEIGQVVSELPDWVAEQVVAPPCSR